MIESGLKFTDEDFPPCTESLLGSHKNCTCKVASFKDLEWKRASEIYPKGKLFNDALQNDIVQGALGDCYFIAAISSLAAKGCVLDE